MSIKKIKPKSPDPYLGKTTGDNTLARIAHVNQLVDQINNNSYKSYVAYLDQTGTDDPIPTIIENTLGFDITWTRFPINVGLYLGERSSGTFNTPEKYFFNSNLSFYSEPYFSYLDVYESDNSKLILGTYDADGDVELHGRIFIEIRIYN